MIYKAGGFGIIITLILTLLLSGCGHYAVSFSPTSLTVGKEATPTAETTESVASTRKEGS